MPLFHIASRILGTPLLITRAKLDIILAVLGPRIGLPDIQAAMPAPGAKPPGQPSSGVAIVPIHGTLVRRTSGLEAASGLTAYSEIGRQLDAALNDPQVQGILLDIDSPGGETGGVFELAQRIRVACARKPVWAHANDSAFSAAYALGCAATRLTLSPTAGVGSIGVIAVHVDQSVKDAKEGLVYTAIHAGERKNDFTPHAPLSPAAATSLQAEVDRLYGIFAIHVALMRGLEQNAVQATNAGLFFGEAAIATGLADAVLGFDQVLTEFTEALQARNALAGSTRAPKAQPSPQSLVKSEHVMQDDQNQPENQPPLPNPTAQPTSVHGEAQAIAELCLMAGVPEQTAELLGRGLSEAQVRRLLLEARASQTEITSLITPESAGSSRPENSPIIAAVKKLSQSMRTTKE